MQGLIVLSGPGPWPRDEGTRVLRGVPRTRAAAESAFSRPGGGAGAYFEDVAYSLHAGEVCGLTWHQERPDGGIVWLLAARFHRSGKPEDAYPHFRELDANGRLLPTREDFRALTRSLIPTLARSLSSDVPALRRVAECQPGTIVRGLVGGRISVRLFKEAGHRPMLTVAISWRLIPGDMDVSPGLADDRGRGVLPRAARRAPGRGR